MSWRDFVQNNKKYWMEYLAGLVYFILLLVMIMGVALLIVHFSGNMPEAQGQDASITRKNSILGGLEMLKMPKDTFFGHLIFIIFTHQGHT